MEEHGIMFPPTATRVFFSVVKRGLYQIFVKDMDMLPPNYYDKCGQVLWYRYH